MNVHIAMPRPLQAANDTTNPPAAPTVTADMLAAIAARVSAQWSEASEAGWRDEMDIYSDRLEAVGHEASFAESVGAAGVLLQLGVARGQLDTLYANHTDDDAGLPLLFEISRLLIRVTQWVERASGVSREAAGLNYYGSAAIDGVPFAEHKPLLAAAE